MVDSVILCILSYEVLDFNEVSLYEWYNYCSRYHAQRYCQHLLDGMQYILAEYFSPPDIWRDGLLVIFTSRELGQG